MDSQIVTSAASVGTTEHPERLLRLVQVLDMVGVGKTTLYSMMKTGEFPPSRKVRHMAVWVESEVREWIRAVAQSKKPR